MDKEVIDGQAARSLYGQRAVVIYEYGRGSRCAREGAARKLKVKAPDARKDIGFMS